MGWIGGRHLWSKWLRMDLEKARWYRNILAVLTILGAAVGLGLAVRQLLPSPAFAQQNFAIVLDRSAAMAASFDGQSKLEAAKNKVRDQLKEESSGYSLRTFGGACDQDAKRLVSLKKSNGNDVKESLKRRISPSGDSSLVSAVIGAIDEFDGVPADKVKSIVVVAGGKDTCEESPQQINEHLRKMGIELRFHFIGLRFPPYERAEFQAIAKSTGGDVKFVESGPELADVLRQIIVVGPLLEAAGTVTKILDDVIEKINEAARATDNKDYSKADDSREQARRLFEDSSDAFDDLRGRQTEPSYQQLYELERSNRELQETLLDDLERGVEYQKKASSGDADAKAKYDRWLQLYNEHIAKYNETVDKVKKLIAEISS